ncbi:hypothetical protein [Proteiniborus sp.]|uniref:hypothetical protein n=1 Tax=Proteiniborus sp. TaxID=2079015 RepID=UPI0033194F61
MRRRKTRKRFRSSSILYISAIVALNFIGLGYAMWEETHNMNVSITTGDIDPGFDSVSTVSENGEVKTTLSEDKKKLFIEGIYYPSSIIDISIGVKNEGSIPVVLNNNKAVRTMSFNTGISNLQELSDEEFMINIQSDREPTPLYAYDTEQHENRIQTYRVTTSDSDIQDYQDSSYLADIMNCQEEIQSLESSINKHQETISALEKLINEANSINEQHSFNHSIQYIQIH